MENIKMILLVDDDDITNFLNLRLLSNLKISKRIEVRKNGKDALSYLEDCKYFDSMCPDLILLDISMPGMDAAEFLEAYQKLQLKNARDIKIAFLSTCQNAADIALRNTYQIADHIIKPLTTGKLQVLLNSIYSVP